MRRDWWGRTLAALMGIWIAGMVATPATSRVSVPDDLLRAQRALPDRTRVVSAQQAAPESDRTPPAPTVARDNSPACVDGGRRLADGLPTASVVELTCIRHRRRIDLATAPRRRRASGAHTLPPALGPPSSLV